MESHPQPNKSDDNLDYQWVQALAAQLERHVQDAEDAAQETCLAAVRAPIDGAPRARGWLRRTLENALNQQRRSQGRRIRRELAAAARLPLESEPVDVEVARRDMLRDVAKLARELDEPYQSTLLMHFADGLAPREISLKKQIPVATVYTHLNRGIEKLRQRLNRQGGIDLWRPIAIIPKVGGLHGWLVGAVTMITLGALGVRFASKPESAAETASKPATASVTPRRDQLSPEDQAEMLRLSRAPIEELMLHSLVYASIMTDEARQDAALWRGLERIGEALVRGYMAPNRRVLSIWVAQIIERADLPFRQQYAGLARDLRSAARLMPRDKLR